MTNASIDNWSRVTEVEAWTASTTSINWLVTDQLGTPRIILDQSGSLANVKRHDYLPFGEELFAGVGGRTTAQGYGGGDGVRQKFTQKERDNETGLDYFLARYYSNLQGRFTSADSFGGSRLNPQTLNLYSYVQNDPLKFTDPSGHFADPVSYNPARCALFGGMGCSGEIMWQTQKVPQKPNPATVINWRPDGKGDIPGDGDLIVSDINEPGLALPGSPRDNPGETPFERYTFSPKRTALEAISKDRQLYGSYNLFGITGGNFDNRKNWKLGVNASLAYFTTTEMTAEQRDSYIRGPAFNITAGPVGGYFPITGGRPAVVLNLLSFTSVGVNVSGTEIIPR